MTLTEDDLKLLEQQIRTVIRAEIVSAFGKLAASAGWYTSGFGELTESAAHMLKDAVEMATRELIPAEPEPVLCGAPNYSDRCELPVGHEGRHAQGIMSWPAGTGRPVTPEPVNPFAPKRTPQEWADAIKALIAEADADGSELWVEYVGGAPRIRIGPPDSTGADDPIIWGSK